MLAQIRLRIWAFFLWEFVLALVRPFCALRVKSEWAAQVASLPYDVVSSEEARAIVAQNSKSFLRVVKPEVDLSDGRGDPYHKAKENLDRMIQEGYFVSDESPCFYIYRQTWQGRAQTGIVATCSVDEYLDGTILKHEQTRPDKENDRILLMEACQMQTGLVFLAYKAHQEMDQIMKSWTHEKPHSFSFVGEHEVEHTLWVVNDPVIIDKIQRIFAEIPSLYVADGHHRSAAASKVAQKMREKSGDRKKEYNYFLSVLFPDRDLKILEYNRLVRGLESFRVEEFLKRMTRYFSIKPSPKPYRPQKPHEWGMYVGGSWFSLEIHREFLSGDIYKDLDVALLQEWVFSKQFGITDPRRDERLEFVGGIRGLSYLQNEVDEGRAQIALVCHPTSMSELMAVADRRMMMPPKSTWFEPKLLSGLILHRI